MGGSGNFNLPFGESYTDGRNVLAKYVKYMKYFEEKEKVKNNETLYSQEQINNWTNPWSK